MKQGLTLTELADRLKTEALVAQDFVTPTPSLSVFKPSKEDEGHLEIHDIGTFRVNNVFHGQIAQHLGVPKRYYDMIYNDHSGLWETTVNTLLTERPSHQMVRTLNYPDPNRKMARAFLSSHYKRLDNFLVANTVLEVIDSAVQGGYGTGFTVESCDVTETNLYIQIIFPFLDAEIKPGEVVKGGIVIYNSEVGYGKAKLQQLFYVVICGNGAIRPQDGITFEKVHRGREANLEDKPYLTQNTIEKIEDAIVSEMRDTLAHIIKPETFQSGIAQIREGAKRIMLDAPKTVERLQDVFDFSDFEKNNILQRLIEGGDSSQWGLSNAITRAAQDVESYDRAIVLEEVGGKVAFFNENEWSRHAL